MLWLQSRQISQTCRFDRKEGSPAASLTAERRHPVEKRWNMCRVFPSLRSGNIIFSLSSLKVTHTLTFKRILVNNRFPRQPFIYLFKKNKNNYNCSLVKQCQLCITEPYQIWTNCDNLELYVELIVQKCLDASHN